jgi:hypothetical protein
MIWSAAIAAIHPELASRCSHTHVHTRTHRHPHRF